MVNVNGGVCRQEEWQVPWPSIWVIWVTNDAMYGTKRMIFNDEIMYDTCNKNDQNPKF